MPTTTTPTPATDVLRSPARDAFDALAALDPDTADVTAAAEVRRVRRFLTATMTATDAEVNDVAARTLARLIALAANHPDLAARRATAKAATLLAEGLLW